MRSKYETHVRPYLDRIKMWVAKGATCQEIADKLKISRDSLNQYKSKYADVYDALMAPRGDVDDSVECALYKRCIGYDYEEVTRWQTIGRGGELIWLENRTTRHLPPDPNSIQFWLTNRRNGEWKRMPEPAEENGGESGVVMLPEVKDE
jgi:hypothetical protein